MPDEEAKAVQEMAKATREMVQAAEKTGSFFGQFIEAPLSQLSGIWEDKLRYARWERQVRLLAKSKAFLTEMGVDQPTRRLPLNVGIPLLEAATLEEDDELQDIWARLLANATNSDSGIEVKRMLISILKDMGLLEVQLLNSIVNAPREVFLDDDDPYVATEKLPDEYTPRDGRSIGSSPPEEVQVALWNLSRLGCVEPVLSFGGTSINSVAPTALGRRLVQACTVSAVSKAAQQP